jgi:hypothetical protein
VKTFDKIPEFCNKRNFVEKKESKIECSLEGKKNFRNFFFIFLKTNLKKGTFLHKKFGFFLFFASKIFDKIPKSWEFVGGEQVEKK